jgi:DNA-binding XRE family transcriptional regulator
MIVRPKSQAKTQGICGGSGGRFLFRLLVVAAIPQHQRVAGQTIRHYRKRAGLSLETLAEKADLHHNYVGDVERGKENISLAALVRIAKALGVRVRDLVHDL